MNMPGLVTELLTPLLELQHCDERIRRHIHLQSNTAKRWQYLGTGGGSALATATGFEYRRWHLALLCLQRC
jgi:hypothetical protein